MKTIIFRPLKILSLGMTSNRTSFILIYQAKRDDVKSPRFNTGHLSRLRCRDRPQLRHPAQGDQEPLEHVHRGFDPRSLARGHWGRSALWLPGWQTPFFSTSGDFRRPSCNMEMHVAQIWIYTACEDYLTLFLFNKNLYLTATLKFNQR